MTETRALMVGCGIAVPPIRVDNHMLARIMDTSDDWIRERSGVETRYFVEPGVGSAELGTAAAQAAIEDSGIDAGEIDYIVCATMTPDHYFPGCGTLIQHGLGIDALPALDIRQQCAGFAYGLQVVDILIRSGRRLRRPHQSHALCGGDLGCVFRAPPGAAQPRALRVELTVPTPGRPVW
jgi:3-oxoacyl-[acyl-carrier-protein] synthase-3